MLVPALLNSPESLSARTGLLNAGHPGQRQALKRDRQMFLSEWPSYIFLQMHRDVNISHNKAALPLTFCLTTYGGWAENERQGDGEDEVTSSLTASFS